MVATFGKVMFGISAVIMFGRAMRDLFSGNIPDANISLGFCLAFAVVAIGFQLWESYVMGK